MSLVTYEQRLDSNLDWALREGSMHFEKHSAVHETLKRIAQRLDEIGVEYAIAGGMAMFFHGYRRFTEDVDILVTREGLRTIHEKLDGLGYLPPFSGSKNLRDTISGVRIEFLIAGDYPGDGKPKPVAFPEPQKVSTTIDDVQVISLPQLIELKVASGMTNPGRLNDLGDVQQLIKTLSVSEDVAEELDAFVREKFRELWTAVHDNPDPE
ncbi:MAG: hypothetical protein AB7U20_18760 [Planctomycetaceae bacterium]